MSSLLQNRYSLYSRESSLSRGHGFAVEMVPAWTVVPHDGGGGRKHARDGEHADEDPSERYPSVGKIGVPRPSPFSSYGHPLDPAARRCSSCQRISLSRSTSVSSKQELCNCGCKLVAKLWHRTRHKEFALSLRSGDALRGSFRSAALNSPEGVTHDTSGSCLENPYVCSRSLSAQNIRITGIYRLQSELTFKGAQSYVKLQIINDPRYAGFTLFCTLQNACHTCV